MGTVRSYTTLLGERDAMAHMESDIQNIAETLEIEVSDLFDRAYMEERGYLWGIQGPQTQYKNWKERNGCVPQYVLAFLRKRGAELLQ